jgi:heavy metal translocating P-type ATPase
MIAAAESSAALIDACDYCGLPLPKVIRWAWPWSKKSTDLNLDPNPAEPAADKEPIYCCSGCRFAADVAREQNGEVSCNRWLVRLLASVFLTINVTMITMVLWSLDVYGVPASLNESTAVLLADVLRWASWLLSLPVLWMLGEPLAQEAKAQLRQGRIATDALLLAGVVAALVYSGISLWLGEGAVYCEIACVVLLLVTLGRWLESMGKIRATAAIDSLAALLPATVRRLDHADGEWNLGSLSDASFTQVPLAEVQPGDQLWIKAGERIPVDARIVAGSAAVDEQLINGESQPLTREPGMVVPGGALSLDGSLILKCTAASQQSSLNRIVQAVRAAQLEAGSYQQLVDRIAAVFTPVVLLIALLTLSFHAYNGSWSNGTLAALSVILIACPCALGIATPLALWTSMGRASQAQVLFRNGRALEQLARSSVLLFDKTGTLTTGTSTLARIVCDSYYTGNEALDIARIVAEHSQHPLSRAIVEAASLQPDYASVAEKFCLQEIQTLPGHGLAGVMQFDQASKSVPLPVLLGSARMMEEKEMEWPTELCVARDQLAGGTGSRVYLAVAGVVRVLFVFEESIRPSVKNLIAKLRQHDWQIELLSGDHPARVEQLARELQVDGRGGLLPSEKTLCIRQFQADDRRVVMVGDGINDAPALAAADVGIALGCGADLSRQSADLCLLGDELARIPWAIDLARMTLRVVKQNLAWAFGYNLVGVGLAVTGRLNPVWAAFFMVAGSLVVIANSMRLAAVPLPSDVTSSDLLQCSNARELAPSNAIVQTAEQEMVLQ